MLDHDAAPRLTPKQMDEFHRDGFLILRSFYDLKREIEPIQRDIHQLIGILIRKYGVRGNDPALKVSWPPLGLELSARGRELPLLDPP